MSISNRLGIHHLMYHQNRERDFAHFTKIRPASYKPFEWMWSNKDYAQSVLKVLPADCIILARDHPLSEQHGDMNRDPVGTGRRHANEWKQKIDQGRYHFPVDRTYFLGLNEPDAVSGNRQAIDIYTVAFLDRLREHGLKGAAFNFSTGHPRTKNGTNHPSDRKDYAFFENSHQAILRGGHIAIQHIYGRAAMPLVPGHYDALADCPWTDVTWVIGECGINESVGNPEGSFEGYKKELRPVESYPQWIEKLIRGTCAAAPHLAHMIHSWMVFTYDFSSPWESKDVSGQSAPSVAAAFEQWAWNGLDLGVPTVPAPKPEPKPTEPPATPTPIPATKLQHPVKGARITQHFFQNPQNYARFGLPGHNGTDFGIKQGTPILCLADGVVAYADTDTDYGNYVRVWHAELGAWSFYAHMHVIGVKQGQKVTRGQTLGQVGSTGNSTGPHLHLEIRDANSSGGYSELSPMPKGRVDPESWCSLYGLKL